MRWSARDPFSIIFTSGGKFGYIYACNTDAPFESFCDHQSNEISSAVLEHDWLFIFLCFRHLSHSHDLIWGFDDILDSKWEQRIVLFEKQNNRHLRPHVLMQRSHFYASCQAFRFSTISGSIRRKQKMSLTDT